METINLNEKETAELLKKNDNFIILSHTSPDGDTMGSAHALGRALQSFGKKVQLECADPLSPRFHYMSENFVQDDLQNAQNTFVVAVDVADIKLLGDLEKKYENKINLAIDHHTSHSVFAEKTCLKLFAAAAEIIYFIIGELGAAVTPEIAKCIYTGIATDTGCFRFPNTSQQTHLIAVKLMNTCDFGVARLNHILFDTKTKERLALEIFAISQIQYFFDGKCAVIILDKEHLDTVDSEDVNGISILSRQIIGVEVGVTIKEKLPGEYRVSLRSNSYLDVGKLSEIFGGGGHFNAAGYKFNGSAQDCVHTLIAEIGNVIR
jgi:phosphoesterase RecJ-like protein